MTDSTVTFRRFLLLFYLLVLVGLLAGSGAYFWQTRQEYQRLTTIETQARKRLAEAETKLKEQQRVLDRLRNDPAYVELVIRRRLGYAKPDELIFRFEN